MELWLLRRILIEQPGADHGASAKEPSRSNVARGAKGPKGRRMPLVPQASR
jgi:hypothetical protein